MKLGVLAHPITVAADVDEVAVMQHPVDEGVNGQKYLTQSADIIFDPPIGRSVFCSLCSLTSEQSTLAGLT
jgi:hypothetical protein